MSTSFYPVYANRGSDEPSDLKMDDKEPEQLKDDKRSPIPDLEEPGSRIWQPYLELSDRFDTDLVITWRDDMDLLLLFAALFSASVTAFVIESYKSLLPDSGEVTVSVLLQISQQLANATHAPVAMRPSFQTDPRYTSVNVFWFMSLAFSLTCALAAVLVKQWARRYLRFPRSYTSTSERARARQYMFENMQWWKMEVIVGMIPGLLHISLLLFFIGLLIFLHIINNVVAIYMFVFSGTGTILYMWLTIAPLVFPGCPYKTPFSDFLRLLLQPSFHVTDWLKPPQSARKVTVELYSLIGRFLQPLVDLEQCLVINFYRTLPGIPRRGRRLRQAVLRSGQNIQAYVVLSWSSALRATSRTLHWQTISHIIAERRQLFCNELTPRDTRALTWAMAYSNRDVDMFAIINAVPDFVHWNASKSGINEVLSVMWNCGVITQTIKRLRSTTFTTNSALGVTFLETTIWLTRCSTDVLTNAVELDIVVMMEIAFIFSREINTGNDDSDLAQLYWLVLSNIVLHLIYKLEKHLEVAETRNETQMVLSESTKDVVKTVVDLTNYFSRKISENRRDDDIRRLLRVLRLGILPLSEAGNRTPLKDTLARETLRVFRSEWATSMLGSQPLGSLHSLHQKLALPSMSDMATHLQHFPHSSCDSQVAIFTLFNDLLANNEQKGKPRPTANDFSMVFSAYGFVLFGSELTLGKLNRLNRSTVHADFIDRVNVREARSNDEGDSEVTVDISFSRYCKILNEWLSSLKARWPPNSESLLGGLKCLDHGGVLDLQAGIIRTFIENRARGRNESSGDEVMPVVDSTHLADARELRMTLRKAGILDGISSLITTTARRFRYDLQLRQTYNISTHGTQVL